MKPYSKAPGKFKWNKKSDLKLMSYISSNSFKIIIIIKSITDPDKNKFDPASEISLGRWQNYFYKLYNNNQIDGELPKQIVRAKGSWVSGGGGVHWTPH